MITKKSFLKKILVVFVASLFLAPFAEARSSPSLSELQAIIADLVRQVEAIRVKIDALIIERSVQQGIKKMEEKTPLPPPPVITGLTIQNIFSENADVSWQTDVLATGFVYFATSSPVTKFAPFGSSFFVRDHVLTLPDLEPENLYYVVVESAGPEGVKTRSSEQTFSTPRK